MIMFLLPLLYALTMNLKTKKVPEYFFCKLQIVLVELYNHIGRGTKMVKKLITRFARRSGRLGMLCGQSHKKKAESVFEEVGMEPKNSKRRA